MEKDLELLREVARALTAAEFDTPAEAIEALIALDAVRDDLPNPLKVGFRAASAAWAGYHRRRAAVLMRCATLWPSEAIQKATEGAVSDWTSESLTAAGGDPVAAVLIGAEDATE